MIQNPAIKPHYRLKHVTSETVVCHGETGSLYFQGRAFVRLLPLLSGELSTDEIVDHLQDEVPTAEVYFALLELEKAGVLMEVDSAIPYVAVALLSEWVSDVPAAYRKLKNTSVTLTVCGNIDPAPLAQQLLMPIGEAGDLEIVLTDSYQREELREINARALATGRPWLLAKPTGSVVLIGPLFHPHDSGCWECMSQRLQEEQFWGHLRPSNAAWEFLAREATRTVLLPEQTSLSGTLCSVDLRNMRMDFHPLVRRPQCPACGEVPYQNPALVPIELCSQPVSGGEYRTVLPEETLKKYRHHISPYTGVVQHLERVGASNDDLIHNYTAGLNPAAGQSLRTYSGGKGVTDLHARASALCEALERYSGRFHGEEARVQASFAELGEQALHPNALLLFSDQQYAMREELNRLHATPGHQIPLPFDEHAVLDWTAVWSLTEQRWKYLLTSSCYFGYPESLYSRADSNGCAAGNTLEEAILQGFFELVERDCVAIWWYNRLQRPAVDLTYFELPYVMQLQQHYQALGREIWALDITNDLGVPCFVAVSRVVDRPHEEILCGFGAHSDPHLALLRAMTEMNQFLPALSSPAQQDAITRRWWRTATLENQPYLQPSARLAATKVSDFPHRQASNLRDEVLRCQALVEARGLEMLVLNQTRPDIGLPVVKVIVPGLRHFWNRFASGRLYEVPVQQGWVATATQEQDLNPLPIFW